MATIWGDTEGMLESRAKGQTLTGLNGDNNYIYGDAFLIEDRRGGNDVLTGGASSTNNLLFGDAHEMSGNQGGNDVLIGGSNSALNLLYGDAFQMFDSHGGNDVLTGGANFGYYLNKLYGDAFLMFDSKGGNDVLTGGSSTALNFLYGDAVQMSGSEGGNDVMTGDANSSVNELYGDALRVSDSQCGNDTLIASINLSFGVFKAKSMLYGDAQSHLDGNVHCGNDRLISGTGNDDMWGDIGYSGITNSPLDLTCVTTGQDVFIFSANNGTDTIHDFRHGEDKIELNGIGVASFDELMSHLQSGETNTVITFESNTITVIGVTEMTAADFLFT